MADDKIKLPKKFDTTSRLKLEDAFDDDEITLVDEIVEPDSVAERKKREDSVTERLPTPKEKKQSSVVNKSQKSEIYLLDLLKELESNDKAKKIIFLALVVILVLSGLVFLSKR